MRLSSSWRMPGRTCGSCQQPAAAKQSPRSGSLASAMASRSASPVCGSSGGRNRVALETGWEFRRWADGTVLFAQQLGEACVRRYGEHTWTMHRADLLNLLASALGEDVIQLGSRCTGASQDADKVTLTFATGEPVHADVAIAADGIHSVLREHVTPASF